MTDTRERPDLIEAAGRGTVIAWWAREAGDRLAICSPHGDRTFAQLDRRANQLARALTRRGLTPGDAVAVMCGNRPEFAEVWAACMRSGLRLTAVGWQLTTAESAYIVDDCEAKALIIDARLSDRSPAGTALPHLTTRLAIGGTVAGCASYDAVLGAEADGDPEAPTLGSIMLYTSGTTGRPKGVRRAPANDLENGVYKVYGYADGDVHLCTGPLYHAAPLAISMAVPLSTGTTVVLMDGWNAEHALQLIERHRVTHTHMVPTMFHRLLALPEAVRRRYDLSSLRFILHGAAPCPVAVKRAMMEWLGPIVHEYYAATEGAGTSVDAATWLRKPGTVGRPRPREQVIVGDDEARPLPANHAGLVWLRAPDSNRFQYFKDTRKTASAYRGEYFTLGDVGYLDDDGYLFLTDRSANLIISGGVNIYPAEVDAVLLEHPDVADAAVIGVPNEEWGEEVKAVVELKRGRAASSALAEELMSLCRSRLAHYKCPRSIDFVDALPRADNGKVYKRLLRERYRTPANSSAK